MIHICQRLHQLIWYHILHSCNLFPYCQLLGGTLWSLVLYLSWNPCCQLQWSFPLPSLGDEKRQIFSFLKLIVFTFSILCMYDIAWYHRININFRGILETQMNSPLSISFHGCAGKALHNVAHSLSSIILQESSRQ